MMMGILFLNNLIVRYDKNFRIDQIYKHITYFTLKFSNWILEKNGMYLYDYEKSSYHGGLAGNCKKENNFLNQNFNKITIQTEKNLDYLKKRFT